MKKLYIVIPCYNEEEVLCETAKRLKVKLAKMIEKELISSDSKVCFVNDGSRDKTWSLIETLHQDDSMFSGINLSRNKGHQNALMAGLMYAKDKSDMVISMDADLQDDIEVIDQFISEYENGADIVYGVRSSRKTDSFLKRFTAEGYYKVMKMMGCEIVFNHADYRLLSKRALEGLAEFEEVNLFLRGIIPMIGYKTSVVTYERNERFAGESKYPLKKMLAFAFEGITSLSIKPIKSMIFFGASFFVISILMIIYFVINHLIGSTVSGWSSIIVSIWGIGGLQLMAIGIVGEYIGKVYMETKKRPRYLIMDVLDENSNQKELQNEHHE